MLKNYWVNHIDKDYSKKKYQRPSAHDQEFIMYIKKFLIKLKNSKDKLINIKNVLVLIENNKINFNLLFRIFIYYKWKEKNNF